MWDGLISQEKTESKKLYALFMNNWILSKSNKTVPARHLSQIFALFIKLNLPPRKNVTKVVFTFELDCKSLKSLQEICE